jgi:hypothetical protein
VSVSSDEESAAAELSGSESNEEDSANTEVKEGSKEAEGSDDGDEGNSEDEGCKSTPGRKLRVLMSAGLVEKLNPTTAGKSTNIKLRYKSAILAAVEVASKDSGPD